MHIQSILILPGQAGHRLFLDAQQRPEFSRIQTLFLKNLNPSPVAVRTSWINIRQGLPKTGKTGRPATWCKTRMRAAWRSAVPGSARWTARPCADLASPSCLNAPPALAHERHSSFLALGALARDFALTPVQVLFTFGSALVTQAIHFFPSDDKTNAVDGPLPRGDQADVTLSSAAVLRVGLGPIPPP